MARNLKSAPPRPVSAADVSWLSWFCVLSARAAAASPSNSIATSTPGRVAALVVQASHSAGTAVASARRQRTQQVAHQHPSAAPRRRPGISACRLLNVFWLDPAAQLVGRATARRRGCEFCDRLVRHGCVVNVSPNASRTIVGRCKYSLASIPARLAAAQSRLSRLCTPSTVCRLAAKPRVLGRSRSTSFSTSRPGRAAHFHRRPNSGHVRSLRSLARQCSFHVMCPVLSAHVGEPACARLVAATGSVPPASCASAWPVKRNAGHGHTATSVSICPMSISQRPANSSAYPRFSSVSGFHHVACRQPQRRSGRHLGFIAGGTAFRPSAGSAGWFQQCLASSSSCSSYKKSFKRTAYVIPPRAVRFYSRSGWQSRMRRRSQLALPPMNRSLPRSMKPIIAHEPRRGAVGRTPASIAPVDPPRRSSKAKLSKGYPSSCASAPTLRSS